MCFFFNFETQNIIGIFLNVVSRNIFVLSFYCIRLNSFWVLFSCVTFKLSKIEQPFKLPLDPA